MSLISLYREFLDNKDKVADYYLMDSQIIVNLADINGFSTENFEDKVWKEQKKIRAGKKPQDPEYFLKLMEAEAEWSTASFRWKKTPLRYPGFIGTKLVERKVREAKDLITNEEASETINYPKPGDYRGFNPKKDFGKGASFGDIVLYIDWLEYVLEPTEIQMEDMLRKTRKQSFEYYLGDRENFSHDVEKFQLSLMANGVAWIENMHRYYTDSDFFKEIADNITSGVEKEFGVNLKDYRAQGEEVFIEKLFEETP